MAVLATSILIIEKKTEEKKIEQIPYIQYSITFKDQIEILLDSKTKINVISQAFASQLGLTI